MDRRDNSRFVATALRMGRVCRALTSFMRQPAHSCRHPVLHLLQRTQRSF